MGLFKGSKAFFRYQSTIFLILCRSYTENLIIQICTCRIQDCKHCICNLRSNAVSLKYCDCIRFHDLSLLHWHIVLIVPYILGSRTHDPSVIQLVFDIVGHPAYHTAAHK